MAARARTARPQQASRFEGHATWYKVTQGKVWKLIFVGTAAHWFAHGYTYVASESKGSLWTVEICQSIIYYLLSCQRHVRAPDEVWIVLISSHFKFLCSFLVTERTLSCKALWNFNQVIDFWRPQAMPKHTNCLTVGESHGTPSSNTCSKNWNKHKTHPNSTSKECNQFALQRSLGKAPSVAA